MGSFIDPEAKWSNGEAAVVVRHVGYGWGSLYKNFDGTYCLMKSSGRRYKVRELSEIRSWRDVVDEACTKKNNGPTLYDVYMRMNNVKAAD